MSYLLCVHTIETPSETTTWYYRIPTDLLKEMIAQGCLVVLSPIVFGIFFGKEALAGLLPGAMTFGVHMAISASNTGGAWDNAKKYIESGGLEGHAKGSEVCRRWARPIHTQTSALRCPWQQAITMFLSCPHVWLRSFDGV